MVPVWEKIFVTWDNFIEEHEQVDKQKCFLENDVVTWKCRRTNPVNWEIKAKDRSYTQVFNRLSLVYFSVCHKIL